MTIRARIQKPWLLSLVTWSDSERRQTRIPASLNKCLERGTTEILKNLKIMFLKDGVVFLTRWLMAPGQQPCLSYLQTFPSWSGTLCTGQMSCEGVFTAGLKTGIISLYDCVFKRNPGYNQKLHRDDREHAKSLGLHVNEEERERPVCVLTSSVYGWRIHQPVEPPNRDHCRAGHVKADFYRKNDIPSIKAPGFGHISPA
ncbi:uncharacterized protein C5orf49 homolog isoform X1 [Orcinus orca]|uniref:uncharacterized protein C5orf49 homolog isoform X1 n=1 Tax=Orcinus orca TaxID=9733 RepID=UPI002112300B|nr:uncharacterized protein C5orf49 homolog isoform X1 [Orcinus orca]